MWTALRSALLALGQRRSVTLDTEGSRMRSVYFLHGRHCLWLVLAAFSVSSAASAAEPSSAESRPAESRPAERLLAENPAVYLRFDGLESHRQAYDRTAFAEAMRGDLGGFVDYMVEFTLEKYRGATQLESVMEGAPPDELVRLQTVAKALPAAWAVIQHSGFVVGIEIEGSPASVRTKIVFPHGKPLFLVARLWLGDNDDSFRQREIDGLTVLVSEEASSKPGEAPKNLAFWVEGDDLAIVSGSEPVETLFRRCHSLGEANLTRSPLFQRVAAFHEYEVHLRGFVDMAQIAAVAKASSDDEDFVKLFDRLGLSHVRHVAWHTGFAGRYHRHTIEASAPGERQGALKSLTDRAENPGALVADLALNGLPPLPADVQWVRAIDVPPAGLYAGVREIVGSLAAYAGDGIEDETRQFEEDASSLAQSLQIDLQRDLLDALGSTVVVYAAPSEGPLSLGAGLAIRVKDAVKLRHALDALGDGVSNHSGGQIQLRRVDYRGATLQMLSQANGSDVTPLFTPTFAIHHDWLVLGLTPQTVQGHVLRGQGEIPAWQPSPLLAEAIAHAKSRSPQSRIVSIGQRDPRPMLEFLFATAPVALGYFFESELSSADFDVSKIPHSQTVVKSLEPGVSIVTDDGETIRLDGFESAPFPFDGNWLPLYYGVALGIYQFGF